MENNTMKTPIWFCTGLHETGMPILQLREVISECPEEYLGCSLADRERVLASLHRLDVAYAEVQSDINRTGADESPINEWVEKHDLLYEVAREDADTFCATYDQACESLKAIGAKGVN
jgi:hypothetical protein